MSSEEPPSLELKDTDRAAVSLVVCDLRVCVPVIPGTGGDQKVLDSIRKVSDDITQKLRTYISLYEYRLWDSNRFMCWCRLRFKCDGTHAETRFRLSAKRTSPLKSAGTSVQSTTGSRGVPISGSNAGYTMFRGSVKGTGYPLHSAVSPSLPLPCVTACHHISTGLSLNQPRHPPPQKKNKRVCSV
jgi:hypothetical protein